jgi:GMP synthase PP-ATPase subunit
MASLSLLTRSPHGRRDGRPPDLPYPFALRAITSNDGMTADWYRFPHEILAGKFIHIKRMVFLDIVISSNVAKRKCKLFANL